MTSRCSSATSSEVEHFGYGLDSVSATTRRSRSVVSARRSMVVMGAPWGSLLAPAAEHVPAVEDARPVGEAFGPEERAGPAPAGLVVDRGSGWSGPGRRGPRSGS